MARVIDKLPERSLTGRPEKYPAEWFDGRVWALLYGEDYQGRHTTFCSTLHGMAKRRGGALETRALREGTEQIGFAIQYTQFEQREAAA